MQIQISLRKFCKEELFFHQKIFYSVLSLFNETNMKPSMNDTYQADIAQQTFQA